MLARVTNDPRPATPLRPRNKSATRRTLTSRRDALTPDERTAASAVIANRVETLLASRAPGPGVLALYAAKGSEVDTLAIDQAARARGLSVAYPRVITGERALAFQLATPAELVVTGSRFGLREPRPDAPVVELAAISIMIVPGLAFDRAGGRLGWGLGHYDATLATGSPSPHRLPRLVGVGFECQLVDTLPLEAHDIALDVIVTEVATHLVGKLTP